MKRHKLLSILLASALFGFGIGGNFDVGNGLVVSAKQLEQCDFSEINDHEGYDFIDILGSKYDLSEMNPGLLLVIVRDFGRVNSGELSEHEISEIKEYMKELLDKYLENPESISNLPVTLEFGPSNVLINEIILVQNKINDLKAQQESIKNTKMVQKDIDAQVMKIQNEIDKLRRWINYSVFNFNSMEYKSTLCESNIEKSKENLMSYIYVDDNFNLITVDVNSDGSFDVKNSDISDAELVDFVQNGLEYENLKLRDIYSEIEKVRQSKIVEVDQKAKIDELSKEAEKVKAYALGQEIILLNLEREAIKMSRLSVEAINERVSELTEEINRRVENIQKHNSDESYVIKGFSLGEFLSYSGYALTDESGFGIKINLDSDSKIVYQNISGDDYKLSDSDKSTLKKILKREIDLASEELKSLEIKKSQVEQGDYENKYHILDSIRKNIDIKLNDINNYNIILSQL